MSDPTTKLFHWIKVLNSLRQGEIHPSGDLAVSFEHEIGEWVVGSNFRVNQ